MRKTLMTLAAGAAIVAVPAVAQVGLGGAANLNAGAALDPAATVGSVTDRVGQTVDSVDGAANDAVDSAKLTLATREQVRAGAQVTDAKGASIGTVPVSYTHLDVYKRQGNGYPPKAASACRKA